MRKLLAFVVAIVGLGMVLSGCVANTFRTTYAPNSYIQKNYINKTKIPKSKIVGDREIKFYVDKIVDKRKDKTVWMKRQLYGLIPTPFNSTFANMPKTIREVTKKALKRTGWGVVNNRNRANFIIKTTINSLTVHTTPIYYKRVVDSQICILNNLDNKTITRKHIHKKEVFLVATDLTGKFIYIVGEITEMYYKALIDYFSSPEFVNAIKKAYFEMITEGKEKH